MPEVLSPGNFLTRNAVVEVTPNGNFYATWPKRSDGGTGALTSRTFRTKDARYGIPTNT